MEVVHLRINPRATVHQEYMNEDGSTKKEYIEMVFPCGYIFEPTDEELLSYLRKKVKNEVLPIHPIRQDNVYGYSPKTLTGKYGLNEECKWYFFSPRNRKYANGSRPDRAVANAGYWKPTGCEKKIKANNGFEIDGTKRSLDFYANASSHRYSGRTDWKMHEYVLHDHNIPPGTDAMQEPAMFQFR